MAKKFPTFSDFKSVMNPTAQTNTLYAEGYTPGPRFLDRETYNIMKSRHGEALTLCYILQKKYALRISEVLNFNCNNITSTGLVVIRGCKGSNDKLIDIDYLKDFFIYCKKNLYNPFKHLNRFIVYRFYIKYNLNESYHYGSKNAVTHSFRYAKVNEIKEIENNLELAQQVIGHKTIKNTKKYENKKK